MTVIGRSAVANASTEVGENITRGSMALWAPWLYGPHGPMGSMALLAPWSYGPCAILALYLTAAIWYNSFNGSSSQIKIMLAFRAVLPHCYRACIHSVSVASARVRAFDF